MIIYSFAWSFTCTLQLLALNPHYFVMAKLCVAPHLTVYISTESLCSPRYKKILMEILEFLKYASILTMYQLASKFLPLIYQSEDKQVNLCYQEHN